MKDLSTVHIFCKYHHRCPPAYNMAVLRIVQPEASLTVQQDTRSLD